MLREVTLFETIDKVGESIQFLKDFEPEAGYYLAFSGGKDSIVIKELADLAGVKYDAHYSVTTIDPPELVWFIKREHPDVEFDHPPVPFLQKLAVKGFPLRQQRWCCEHYKERGGAGRDVITGIRRAESVKRAKRKPIETCYKDTSKRYFNPIINWTDEDVWEFIREREMKYCCLYDEGFKRIGCLFCPFERKAQRSAEVARYPKYVALYRKYFRRLHATGRASMARWASGDEMFEWWLTGEGNEDPDQSVLFE